MTDPWTIASLASAAYENREGIRKTWLRISNLLLGKKSVLAVTAMPGVGKSVLVDHLTGVAYKQGYSPDVVRSFDVEKSKLKSGHSKRIALSVIPGQDSPQRTDGLEGVLQGKKPIDGIMHVVCNGYTTIRDLGAREYLVKNKGLDTVEKFRKDQFQNEIDDFMVTAEAIRRYFNRHDNKPWMVLAVDKLDLFASDAELMAAHLHYASPGGEFYARLERLRGQVGADNLVVDVVPVCSWLEDFEWAGQTVTSALKIPHRDGAIARFQQVLEDRCRR
jgi:energy-coupling factor transporter ATP-binding protein EcfA2